MKDKSLFGMAGVYEEKTGTFAIITAAASALVRTVHHRMPVILERRHEALWLDPKFRDSETLLPLLRAYDSSLMHGYRVSDIVNDPKNDSPDCLKPPRLSGARRIRSPFSARGGRVLVNRCATAHDKAGSYTGRRRPRHSARAFA